MPAIMSDFIVKKKLVNGIEIIILALGLGLGSGSASSRNDCIRIQHWI